MPVCVLGTRQLCPSTGPKTHSFYVKKVGRQPLLRSERTGVQGSWRWEAGGGTGPRFSPCAIWKKVLGNFLQVGPRPPACEALAVKDLDPRTSGLQGWEEPMAREGNSGLMHNAQDGDAKLGADQTRRIQTKSWLRTLAWSPHFLPQILGVTETRGLREQRGNGGKRRTEQTRKGKIGV